MRSAANEGVRLAYTVRPAVPYRVPGLPAVDVLITRQPLTADGCVADRSPQLLDRVAFSPDTPDGEPVVVLDAMLRGRTEDPPRTPGCP